MQILAARTLKKRRSISDAIDVLRRESTFSDRDRAEISVLKLKLPSEEAVGMLHLNFDCPARGVVTVFLPASFEIRAKFTPATVPRTIKIFDLNGSTVDASGHVLSPDDRELRSVEIVKNTALRNPTELEWQIVGATFDVLGPKSEDYTLMPFAECSFEIPDSIRSFRSIDYAAIRNFQKTGQIAEETFVAVQNLLIERSGSRKPLSRQKFYDALFRFGMWVPKPYPKG